MNALVESFVNKVCTHVTTSDTSDINAIEHLVPMIRTSTPIPVVQKIMSTLCHLSNSNMETLGSNSILKRIVYYVLHTSIYDMPLDLVDNICEILYFTDSTTLNTVMSQYKRSIKVYNHCIRILLGLHIKGSSLNLLFSFVGKLNAQRDTLEELVQHIPVLTTLITQDALFEEQNVEWIVLAFKELIHIVSHNKNLTLTFWKEIGQLMMQAIGLYRERELIHSTILTDSIHNLLKYHDDVNLSFVSDPAICQGICKDLNEIGTDVILKLTDSMSVCPTLVEHMISMNWKDLMSTFYVKYLEGFYTLSASGKKGGLVYIQNMDRAVLMHSLGDGISLHRALFSLKDEDTLLSRCYIYSNNTDTTDLVWDMKSLLRINGEREFILLDISLEAHFDKIVKSQLQMLDVHCVISGSLNGDILFHLFEYVMGNRSLTTGGVDTAMKKYLIRSIVKAREYLTYGMEKYCMYINETYQLEIDTHIPPLYWTEHLTTTCPISLDAIHCPVSASDGHTYELEFIMRHFEKTSGVCTSPMNRSPLVGILFANRCLYAREAAILQYTLSRK